MPYSGSWSEYCVTYATRVFPLDDDADLTCSFILNPMTSVGLMSTAGDAKAVVIPAANSDVGRCLHTLTSERGIEKIQLVRKPADVKHLTSIGGKHVLNMKDEDYEAKYAEVCTKLKPTALFSCIGGKQTEKFLLQMPKGASHIAYGMLNGWAQLSEQTKTDYKIVPFFMMNGWWNEHNGYVAEEGNVPKMNEYLKGGMKTEVGKIFNFEDIAEAMDSFKSKKIKRKLVISTKKL